MRIELSVTSISWIPSEAVEGLPKLPFTFGVAHYDDPPPDRVDQIETMHRADLFREANELKAWVEVEGGKIVDYGHAGRGRIGLTRLKLGSKDIAVPAVAMPTLQDTEVGDGWVRFYADGRRAYRNARAEKCAGQAVLPDQFRHRVDNSGPHDSRRWNVGVRTGWCQYLPPPLDLRPRRCARSEERRD
jgi:hypothetical protein